jgi:hypothetical protein
MHHDDVEVPGADASCFLRGELLVNLLRSGIARPGADRDDFDTRMLLLEQGPR